MIFLQSDLPEYVSFFISLGHTEICHYNFYVFIFAMGLVQLLRKVFKLHDFLPVREFFDAELNE